MIMTTAIMIASSKWTPMATITKAGAKVTTGTADGTMSATNTIPTPTIGIANPNQQAEAWF